MGPAGTTSKNPAQGRPSGHTRLEPSQIQFRVGLRAIPGWNHIKKPSSGSALGPYPAGTIPNPVQGRPSGHTRLEPHHPKIQLRVGLLAIPGWNYIPNNTGCSLTPTYTVDFTGDLPY